LIGKKMRGNPVTGTGVYYPSCTVDNLYAFHGIAGRIDPKDYDRRIISEPQEMMACEKAFRKIWQDGYLYSSRARAAKGEIVDSSMFQVIDRLAGDDGYVFLNICEPHATGHRGYHLVFDPYSLVEKGAIIGMNDLQSFYITITDNLNVNNRFEIESWKDCQVRDFIEMANDVQDVWRVRKQDAVLWLEWIQGIREHYPLSIESLRWVNRQLGAYMHNTIRWITISRGSAAGNAELLFPEKLSLENLVGVVFRKKYYEIEDFVDVYGFPGETPPRAMDIAEACMADRDRGHPIRCPVCRGWMDLPPLEIRDGFSPVFPGRARIPGIEWPVYVMVCRSCGAAFTLENDEYVGQYDELERVY
jgi:hypothetical protein